MAEDLNTDAALGYPTEIGVPRDDDASRAVMGTTLIRMWLNAHRWVHRRAESIELRSDAEGVRTLEIALTIPPSAPRIPFLRASDDTGPADCLLPVSLLRKRKVDLFVLSDSSGQARPLLSREERGSLAARGVQALARSLISRSMTLPMSDEIESDLNTLVCDRSPEAVQALLRLERNEGPTPEVRASRALLMAYSPFRLLLWNLAVNSMIVVRVPYQPGRHEQLRAQYREPVSEVPPGTLPVRWGRAAFRAAGIAPKKLWFPARTLPLPSSNHYRLSAPDGLQISAATLNARELGAVSPKPVSKRSPSMPAVMGLHRSWRRRDIETGSLAAHLYDRDLPEHSVALVQANLRPTASGTLRAIWITAGIATAMLWISGRNLDALVGPDSAAEAASALLLLIPTLMAAYAARPGEHSMTSELLFGIRMVGLIVGLATLAAASSLVFSRPSADLDQLWRVYFAIGAFAFVILSLSLLVNYIMRWPERNAAASDSRFIRTGRRAWIQLRRRLG